jgi:aminoglycoside phosphotransferase
MTPRQRGASETGNLSASHNQRLSAALSPPRVLEAIRNSLPPEAEVSVARCKVTKIRPLSDGTVEIGYQLDLVKPDSGQRDKATIVGRVYQDRTGEHDYQRLLERYRRGECAAALQAFPAYIAELGLLLRTPGDDDALSHVGTALDAKAMNLLLGRYLKAGPSPTEHIREPVQMLSYKPRKRCTVKYRLRHGPGEGHERAIVGKMFRRGSEAAAAFENMSALHRAGCDGTAADGIRVPRPIGYISELIMLIMEYVPSPALSRTLGMPRLADRLGAAARALRKIQACPVRVNERHSAADEVRALRRWIAKSTCINPELAPSLEAVVRDLATSVGDVGCAETALTHGDFASSNVLIGDNEVVVIDFDSMRVADPARDVGSFLAHFHWKGRFDHSWTEEQAATYGAAFIEAYHPGLPSALKPRINFYYRASLLRYACMVSLRPKLRPLTELLVAEAERGFPI